MAMSLRGIKDFPRSEVHQSVVGRRIACPYFKRSPQGAPRADSCFRNGFKDIHKMKIFEENTFTESMPYQQNALEVSDYFSRYENFIRERLPVFFHSRVECLIDPTASEQLSGHMNEILRDCLEVTFAQFKDGEGAMLAGAAATATQATTTGAEQSNGLSQDVGRIFTEPGSSEGRSVQSMHLNAFTPFEDVDMAAEEPVTIVQQGEHFTAGTVANTFGHQAFPINGVFNSDLHIENMGYADPFLPASIMQTQKSWEFEVGNTDNSLWDGSILLQVEMLEEGSEAQ
ncbi:hypothetical protein SLS56_005594 [Neofusicoccum ribis]|uniref:Uncharacterized protein n=1 Tax=Neofusicoccum ribis TaxID=45134 RepID=A0ABR3SU63_9PEZI